MRLQSKYATLDNLPTTFPVADAPRVMQTQANLQYEIAELEKQLEAENAAMANAGSMASGLQQDGENTMPRDVKVFYAWQDDLPRETCRDLIRIAAEEACKIINADKREYHLSLDEGAIVHSGYVRYPEHDPKEDRKMRHLPLRFDARWFVYEPVIHTEEGLEP